MCVNAGCTVGEVPRGCRLTLVTGGKDFFAVSADPQKARLMQRQDLLGPQGRDVPMLLYHDTVMGHTGCPDDFANHGHHMLLKEDLMRLIDLTSADVASWCEQEKGSRIEGPWPGTAYLEVV